MILPHSKLFFFLLQGNYDFKVPFSSWKRKIVYIVWNLVSVILFVGKIKTSTETLTLVNGCLKNKKTEIHIIFDQPCFTWKLIYLKS